MKLIPIEEQKALSRMMQISLPGMSPEQAMDMANTEVQNLELMAVEKPEILQVEPITAIAAIRSVVRMGLSLDPNLALVYVTTRNFKSGEAWKKKLEVVPTVNGLLYMAQRTGQLQDFKRPEPVMENGKCVAVVWEYKTGGEWKTVEKDTGYFQRLAGFSAKQNKGTANALYSSHNGVIDPEFACTKVMKHVLKKLGVNPMMGIVMAKPEFIQTIDPEIVKAEAAEEFAEFAEVQELDL